MKQTPLKRRRKGATALLTAKLDRATRDLARLRKPYCEVCATEGGGWGYAVEAHHIISRSRHALRWDQRNIVCLCFRHHYQGAHGDWLGQRDYRAWMRKYRADDLAYVEAHAQDDGKISIAQKKDLLGLLTDQIAEIERQAA